MTGKAVLGGTFDPVHVGHLRIAIEVCEALALAEVSLMPNAVPPHRAEPGASTEQRLAMVKLATESLPHLGVDTREIERAAKTSEASYMWDTLKELRTESGLEEPLFLIMGGDAFLHLDTWHRWRELLDFAHLAIVQRPGWSVPDDHPMLAYYKEHESTKTEDRMKPSGCVFNILCSQLDVSASGLRQRVQAGQSIHYLVPDAVETYIQQHGLYQ